MSPEWMTASDAQLHTGYVYWLAATQRIDGQFLLIPQVLASGLQYSTSIPISSRVRVSSMFPLRLAVVDWRH